MLKNEMVLYSVRATYQELSKVQSMKRCRARHGPVQMFSLLEMC